MVDEDEEVAGRVYVWVKKPNIEGMREKKSGANWATVSPTKRLARHRTRWI